MNNVNITEEYALCMLKEKKLLYGKELTPYLIVSMIVEMMLDDNLSINEKNEVILNNKVPTANYNKKLYEIIENMKKDKVPLRIVLTSICYSFSTKNLKSILNELKDSMVRDKLITLENKKGLIGNKETITIDESKFTEIINEIKTEILGKGNLTENLILLSSLLNSTRILKNIFNKYEKEELNNRLKEIKDTDIAQKVKVAQSTINTMSAMVTSMMINASTSV